MPRLAANSCRLPTGARHERGRHRVGTRWCRMNVMPLRAPTARPEWIERCITGATGHPLSILANVLTAMEFDHGLRDAFALDEMLRAPMLMHPIGNPICPQFYARPLNDTDITDLVEYLQRHGLKRIAKEVARDAAIARARDCAFHPVRQYLDNLMWDGGRRLNTWLAVRLGAELTPYTQNIGTMFLIGDGGADLRSGLQGGLHARARRPAGRDEEHCLRNPRRRVVLG